jgi:chromosome segregation ATPase
MSSVGELVFALERFEATDADRLEVVGRWQGLEGRRLGRPVLTVLTEGGRRRRLTALPGGQLTATGADAPWRASFAWDGDPASVESAELELGRRLVVELPRPRRRRRRSVDSGLRPSTAVAADAPAPIGDDVRAQLAELRSQMQDLRRERDAAAAPLAELREQHGALEDDHAAAEREAEDLRDERDAAHAELGRLREALASTQAQLEAARAERDAARGETGSAGSELERARTELEQARSETESVRAELERTRAALESTRTELTSAQGDVAERDRGVEAAVAALEAARREHEEAIAEARADAVRRVEAERESSAGLREKLAAAREDAERAKREAAAAIEAEAQETEKLRVEARSAREEAEQTVAGERAEAARLREELASREPAPNGEVEDTAARRMLDRVSRDLERERAASRTLRREIDTLRGETAQHRRLAAAAAAAGATSTAEAPVAADRRSAALREEVSRVSAKRVEAAAAGRSPHRVYEHGPSTPARWGARVVGLVLAGLLLLALAIIVLQVAG